MQSNPALCNRSGDKKYHLYFTFRCAMFLSSLRDRIEEKCETQFPKCKITKYFVIHSERFHISSREVLYYSTQNVQGYKFFKLFLIGRTKTFHNVFGTKRSVNLLKFG